MLARCILPALLLAYTCHAQNYGAAATTTTTDATTTASATSTDAAFTAAASAPPGELLVQLVSVSDDSGSLSYFPESIQAPVGSVVQFQFHPKNHTITQSTFSAPCVPIGISSPNLTTSATAPGIKSGFQPVTPDSPFLPVYNVLINDTKPIWIYCGQPGHCQKGMAMVINQNLSDPVKTLDNYKIAAQAVPLPGANSTTTSTDSAAASTTLTTSTEQPTATTTTVAVTPLDLSTTTAGATGTTTGGAPIASATGNAASKNFNVNGGLGMAGAMGLGMGVLAIL